MTDKCIRYGLSEGESKTSLSEERGFAICFAWIALLNVTILGAALAGSIGFTSAIISLLISPFAFTAFGAIGGSRTTSGYRTLDVE